MNQSTGRMPGHFRWEIDCADCGAAIQADGHFSMSAMDAWLSAHLEAFGHKNYYLTIIPDEKRGKQEEP